MPRNPPPTTDLVIPLSARLRETLTAASRKEGNRITVERYGPLQRHGAPIEWVRWTVTRPDGSSERWAMQYTGANLAGLDEEFAEMERDFTADPRITDVSRTQGA